MNAKLEQILTSIVDEKSLYINQIRTAEEENEAWVRVATKNTITVNECKTIFAVLIKKYLTEKGKSHSTWKLYSMMEDLHLPKEALEENRRDDDPIDEEDDALVELLEVHEEGDYETDEEETPSKSFNSTNSTDNDAGQVEEPKVEENSAPAPKQSVKILNTSSKSVTDNKNILKRSQTVAYADPKQILPTRNQINSPKPTSTNTCPNILKSTRIASTQIQKINLNDNLKRKLISATRANELLIPAKRLKSPERTKTVVVSVPMAQSTANKLSHAIKQACIPSIPSSSSSTPISKELSQYTNNKKAASPPIKPKTSCSSDTPDENESKSSEAVTSQNPIEKPFVTITKINGISTHNNLDDNSKLETKPAEVKMENGIDNAITAELNNWSDQLTPLLYKHLCNSKRFEAFGLYVCNVMNRLPPRLASNLERKVLKLIIEYTAEDIET